MKAWPHLFGKVSSCPEIKQPKFQEVWKVHTSIFETFQNVQSICSKNHGTLPADDENGSVIPRTLTWK